MKKVIMSTAFQDVIACKAIGAGERGVDDDVVRASIGCDVLVWICGSEVDLAFLF